MEFEAWLGILAAIITMVGIYLRLYLGAQLGKLTETITNQISEVEERFHTRMTEGLKDLRDTLDRRIESLRDSSVPRGEMQSEIHRLEERIEAAQMPFAPQPRPPKAKGEG